VQRHRKNLLYAAYIVAIVVLVIVIILLLSPKASAPAKAHSSAPKLSNTGPGNVIALFAVSATAFSTLHWTIRRRKLSSDMLK
jgi:preprotein translocase subunit SecG